MWLFMVNFVIFNVLFAVIISSSTALCSSTYGSEPNIFIPAPPGHTPPCARPGETFCEYVEHYPMQHIRYLISKWGYDYSTLFSDETRDEFNGYFTQPDYKYGPSSTDATGYTYPEPIYIPKPPALTSYPFSGNKYIPPAFSSGRKANYTEEFTGYPDRRLSSKYNGYLHGNLLNHGGFRGHAHHGYFLPTQGSNFPYYEPTNWWRYNRDNKNYLSRAKRSSKSTTKINPDINQNKNATDSQTAKRRNKRQSVLGGPQQLCPTRSQYIMPRAALNSQGNWMYVVNLQDQESKYTQLVKSESCVSQTCAGICSVPDGYNARCEQRYVQKRLVALQSAGQNLYTDVFWFPSCCICTFQTG